MSVTSNSIPAPPLHAAILLFPGLTQLDFTGPLEVFHRVPGLHVDLVWKSLEPVTCAAFGSPGLRVLPSARLDDVSRTDILFVPGGPGVNAVMSDDDVLAWVKRLALDARYVTSVCTGSLILGAAGLLNGYRATSHWAHHQWLAPLGAIPVNQRVVIDRNRVTGAGVSSGIDFALTLVAEIWGERRAQSAQLSMEYDPQPPFDSGSPANAAPELVRSMRELLKPLTDKTGAAVGVAAQRMSED